MEPDGCRRESRCRRGCEYELSRFRPGADADSPFRKNNPSGTSSLNTGVGGNSTTGSGDKKDSSDNEEKILDEAGTGDPNSARLPELVLAPPLLLAPWV